MSKPRLIIIGSLIFIVIFFALVFLGIIPGLKFGKGPGDIKPLSFWGVFNNKETIENLANTIPRYKISYRDFDPQTYESELINALAAGSGPDIFMFHSSWLAKHGDKVVPIENAYLKIKSLRDIFPTVVEQDFNPDGNLTYALPLYLDTLVLLYNQNIFDKKGVALPPKNWQEFQNLIPKLRETDSTGKIVKAAASIGGSEKSVNRAADLISVLMLQSGTKMVDSDFSRATFASNEGAQALNFYVRFANPASEFYTWSDSFKNSLDSFAEESVAMIINYGYQIPRLKEKNPFLAIGVAPLPQPSQSQYVVNFANYWGLAVSRRSREQLSAWDFIAQFTATPAIAQSYAKKTERLPALKTLINDRKDDPDWSIFATQALQARSWPQIDSAAVDETFSKMVADVISGRADTAKSLSEAEATISQLMARKRL